MSMVKWVIIALPDKYFLDLGLFLPGSCLISRIAEVPIGMPGGAGGLLSDGESYPDLQSFKRSAICHNSLVQYQVPYLTLPEIFLDLLFDSFFLNRLQSITRPFFQPRLKR
jgi:hypothetical protein